MLIWAPSWIFTSSQKQTTPFRIAVGPEIPKKSFGLLEHFLPECNMKMSWVAENIFLGMEPRIKTRISSFLESHALDNKFLKKIYIHTLASCLKSKKKLRDFIG